MGIENRKEVPSETEASKTLISMGIVNGAAGDTPIAGRGTIRTKPFRFFLSN